MLAMPAGHVFRVSAKKEEKKSDKKNEKRHPHVTGPLFPRCVT